MAGLPGGNDRITWQLVWRIGYRRGIDVVEQLAWTRVRAGIGEIHGGVDLRLGLFLDVLSRLVVEDARLYQPPAKRRNGIEPRSRSASSRERYLAGSTTEWPRSRWHTASIRPG